MGSKESLGQSHPKGSNLRKEDPRQQRGSERTSFRRHQMLLRDPVHRNQEEFLGCGQVGNSDPPRTISCLGKQQDQEYVTHGGKIK